MKTVGTNKKKESPPFCAKITLDLTLDFSTKEYSLSSNNKEASIVELLWLLLEEKIYL